MPKVIKVDGDFITIGFEDGTLDERIISEFNYPNPQIGDKVEIYSGNGETIIIKADGGPRMAYHREDIGYIHHYLRVNKVLYCVFAFIFGSFGFEFFYTKRYGAGIACCLFCWTGIPEIIGIYKGIVALLEKADPDGYIKMY